jgi:hypothetical protein
MISRTADQEPGILRCSADKYGHPHWERRLDDCSGSPGRVSAAPRADKYGHVAENTSRQRMPDSTAGVKFGSAPSESISALESHESPGSC